MENSKELTVKNVFDFKGNKVRVIVDENGIPWWVAMDVCKALGIKHSWDAVSKLDDDEKANRTITDSAGRPHKHLVVNEAGLYGIIFESRKPQAKEFKRWIKHDVIPSIRKYGMYITDKVIAKLMNDPGKLMDLIWIMKNDKIEQEKKILESEEIIEKQTGLISEMKPKVEFYESFMESSDCISMGTTAKILNFTGIGRNTMFKILREKGILMEGGKNHNIPYQKYMDLEWFKVVPEQRTDTGQFYTQVYVFGKGGKAIRDTINKKK